MIAIYKQLSYLWLYTRMLIVTKAYDASLQLLLSIVYWKFFQESKRLDQYWS